MHTFSRTAPQSQAPQEALTDLDGASLRGAGTGLPGNQMRSLPGAAYGQTIAPVSPLLTTPKARPEALVLSTGVRLEFLSIGALLGDRAGK